MSDTNMMKGYNITLFAVITILCSYHTAHATESYIFASHNPSTASSVCSSGGLFVSTTTSPFIATPFLNGGTSVFTPACLRDPFIRKYFGDYYVVYSDGTTNAIIASSSSLTGTWRVFSTLPLGGGGAFGVNVPSFTVGTTGIAYITMWDGALGKWYETHHVNKDPDTWGSGWTTKAELTDHNGTAMPGVENLYITQHYGTYYLLQAGNGKLQLRTSNDVPTGWSDASADLAVPYNHLVESEPPLFIGNNLVISWAYDYPTTLTYAVNKNGTSTGWYSIPVAPERGYAETTPETDMACGTSGQYYTTPAPVAPSTNLCAVGSASSVTQVGNEWQWTCTLNTHVAQCSSAVSDTSYAKVSILGGVVRIIQNFFRIR